MAVRKVFGCLPTDKEMYGARRRTMAGCPCARTCHHAFALLSCPLGQDCHLQAMRRLVCYLERKYAELARRATCRYYVRLLESLNEDNVVDCQFFVSNKQHSGDSNPLALCLP